ncbi:type II secretion system F family protein [Homoserinimonas sp. OAct 916]|uniref:type II secretion system F family protein n=1 Tax=Homoserinimonas sp. OAct 916 TaxID=2211450 RepID=UPI000DBE794A|nr:type II secretion system F family protein [Homoserinimonas sp. OAct 916]
MVTAIGVMLGLGMLLVFSPLLWPRGVRPRAAATVRSRLESLRTHLALAGFERVPVVVFLVICAVLGVLAAAACQAMFGVGALSVIAGLLGAILPLVVVRRRARAARRASRTVWPDVVDHLVSAVRSGLALPDSVSTLARSGPLATRVAFASFEADYRATGSFGYSANRLKVTLADPVADRLVETLRMARDVGGNDLTRVLRDLAAYLREDASVRAEVEARQGWIMNAARLGVVAPWIVLGMLATRTEAAHAYNTPTGALVIMAGLVVTVLAYRLMMLIARLPEQKRWFS